MVLKLLLQHGADPDLLTAVGLGGGGERSGRVYGWMKDECMDRWKDGWVDHGMDG